MCSCVFVRTFFFDNIYTKNDRQKLCVQQFVERIYYYIIIANSSTFMFTLSSQSRVIHDIFTRGKD